MRTLHDTDSGSSSDHLKRRLIRFKAGERGYVKLDAASALAVSCLAAHDYDNFARIVAACPSVIDQLLDPKKIGHGPIFNEHTIWKVIAYSTSRFKALGGTIGPEVKSVTIAFENFVKYHNPYGKSGPYLDVLKHAYSGSGRGADALSNHAGDFVKFVETLWVRLCPEDNPIRDILDLNETALALDSNLAAHIINIVFSGIDYHLAQVVERRTAYNKAIAKIVSLSGAAPLDALKGATSTLGGGVMGGTVESITKMLLEEVATSIGNKNVSNDFVEMRNFYKTLYDSIEDNASAARFVPGQKALSKNYVDSLLHDAAKGPVNPADRTSNEGDRSTLRDQLELLYTGRDKIIDNEWTQIHALRIQIGKSFSDELKATGKHNQLTPEPLRQKKT